MVRYHLSPEIWTAPLMILGTQWYILFIVLGIAVMSVYVVCLNRFVWRRLYAVSHSRYRLD